jgi:hypothetical protein
MRAQLPRRNHQRPVWPLPHVAPSTLRVAMPNDEQLEVPGALWANLDAWMASADKSAPAPNETRVITRAPRPTCTSPPGMTWRRRPECFGYAAFAMVVFDEVLAVATSGTTVSASMEKPLGLSRINTIELTRLCRSSDDKAKGILRAELVVVP